MANAQHGHLIQAGVCCATWSVQRAHRNLVAYVYGAIPGDGHSSTLTQFCRCEQLRYPMHAGVHLYRFGTALDEHADYPGENLVENTSGIMETPPSPAPIRW